MGICEVALVQNTSVIQLLHQYFGFTAASKDEFEKGNLPAILIVLNVA